jgi:hypothetical protein
MEASSAQHIKLGREAEKFRSADLYTKEATRSK